MREKIKSPHPNASSPERDAELARQAKALAAYVEKWTNVSEEEAQEQQETLDYLLRVLDEDRLGYRKLFPE